MVNLLFLNSILAASSLSTINPVLVTEMSHQDGVIAINFPLRGVWISPHTPGTKVPSHGTSSFGESYAIDFVMIQDNDPLRKPYKKSLIKYFFGGLSLSDFYGWGQTVFSPVDGEVVSVVNSIDERNPVNIIDDLVNMVKVTRDYTDRGGSPSLVAGNYVLIKHSENVYVLLAHLKKGSVAVKIGQKILANQPIGQLGHSGNSTMPHLHMQLMNSGDFERAEGLPFVFKKYEVKRNGGWVEVQNSVPTVDDIVRYK